MIRRAILDAHEVVELVSDRLVVSVDLTRGAHIHSLVERETGVEVLYQDPRGLAAHEVGGWFELFPNAGQASGGVPEHGDVRDLPWRVIGETSGTRGAGIELSVRSTRVPAVLTKTIVLRDDVLTVSERIENQSAAAVPFLWGQHLTLGAGILGDSTEIEAPAGRYWVGVTDDAGARAVERLEDLGLDRYPSAPARAMVFADRLARPEVVVSSPEVTLTVEWDPGAFPALWLWYENRGTAVAPFDGGAVALGVEPQVSTTPGLAEAREDGSAALLAPHAMFSGWVRVTLRGSSPAGAGN